MDQPRGPADRSGPEDGVNRSKTPSGRPDAKGGGRTDGPVDLSTGKVVSDTFFASSSRIVVLGLKSIRGIVLGRLLGPTLYGVLNVPAPFVDILRMLSNIGFNTGVVRLVPDYRQRGRGDLARMILRSTERMTVALGILWCVLLVVFSRPIAVRFAQRPDAIGPIRLVKKTKEES